MFFYDTYFSIVFWNCSDSVIFLMYLLYMFLQKQEMKLQWVQPYQERIVGEKLQTLQSSLQVTTKTSQKKTVTIMV
jgi:hypothetical protein